jgi:DNA-binding transcriptional regulator YiaG
MTGDELRELARIRRLAASGEAQRIREQSNITTRELAESLGLDRATLRRWERGAIAPRGEAALRWAQTLTKLCEAAGAGI